MIRRPPRYTRTDTLFPSATLFRSPPQSCRLCRLVAGRGQVADRTQRLFLVHLEGDFGQDQVVLRVADLGELLGLERAQHAQLALLRSEERTSELQSLMRISYAVFCLKKKNNKPQRQHLNQTK